MTEKPWKCSRCGKRCANPESVLNHVRDRHRGRGEAVRVAKADAEPSLAERAVEAEIDRSLGLHNDDVWLLGE